MVMRIICVESTSRKEWTDSLAIWLLGTAPPQDPQNLWGHMEGVWEDEGAGRTEAGVVLPFLLMNSLPKAHAPLF